MLWLSLIWKGDEFPISNRLVFTHSAFIKIQSKEKKTREKEKNKFRNENFAITLPTIQYWPIRVSWAIEMRILFWHMFAFNTYRTFLMNCTLTIPKYYNAFSESDRKRFIIATRMGIEEFTFIFIPYLAQQIMMQLWFDLRFIFFTLHLMALSSYFYRNPIAFQQEKITSTEVTQKPYETVNTISSIITLQAKCIYSGRRWITIPRDNGRYRISSETKSTTFYRYSKLDFCFKWNVEL